VTSYPPNGWIDLLYCDKKGWHILDFKTDPIQSLSQKQILLRNYNSQIQHYRDAVTTILSTNAAACICFLDDEGKVVLVDVEN
jgi:ATP-dependent exoDNAse (exonuclease V) beta subunit